MEFKYRMFNAPSAQTIDRAAELGCNWVIVHSAGIERTAIDPGTGRETDTFPIYFEDYPKIAQARREQDGPWLEPIRREVSALCERARANGLKVAFHMYEPRLPDAFGREYPELVGVWKRPTQSGTIDVHSHLDPDNPAVWELVRSKYAELARDFPLMDMVIVSTWDGSGSRWCVPKAKMPIHERLAQVALVAREGVRSVRDDCIACFRLWGRNWPRGVYLDSHRLIAEITGVADADELMAPICRAHNDPDEVLPKILAALPADVRLLVAGTIWTRAEAEEMLRLGADGVRVSERRSGRWFSGAPAWVEPARRPRLRGGRYRSPHRRRYLRPGKSRGRVARQRRRDRAALPRQVAGRRPAG